MRMTHAGRLKTFLVGLGGVLLFFGLSPVNAASANLSHSYHADSSVTPGDLMSLDPSRSDYVQLANSDNASRLLGVAVAAQDSLLAVDPSSSTVQVATSGSADVLVSTVNGAVAVGDQIAVSPFSGIGMKTSPGLRVIGLAQTTLTSSSKGASTQTVTDKNGQSHTVTVGLVRVAIAVGTASNSSQDNSLNGLQRFVKSLTGHTVSTLRAVLSLIIALVALIALVVLTYSSIYGSIISIGRNPLAKFAVTRTLGAVLAMAGVMALLAGVTIFLLLR